MSTSTCRRTTSQAIVEPYVRKALPAGLDHQADGLARQSDRQVRDRRPGRRLRPHRPQDHRRHLWRRGAARRRRVLRQGPDQGRPLGRLCGALSRQERGRGRARRALHASSSPTRSASPSRCRSMSTCTAPARSPRRRLEKALAEVMDLSPRGIREHLKLNRPIYARTSAYGHFGRAPDADGGFSWEKHRPRRRSCRRSLRSSRAPLTTQRRRRATTRRRRRLLRPAQGPSAAAAPGRADGDAAAAARARSRARRRPSRSPRCFRIRSTTSASRSASAAASIWWRKRPRIRAPASSAASRSSTAWRRCWR